MYKPSGIFFNRVDSEEYWPTSMKDTIKWFPFLAIMEHTTHIMEKNTGVISSLLKVFALFELRLNYDKKFGHRIYKVYKL